MAHQKIYYRRYELENYTLQQVFQFMENEKSFADADEKKRKSSDNQGGSSAKRIRGGGKEKKQRPKPHDNCPFHHGKNC